jgi:hypothetical protein
MRRRLHILAALLSCVVVSACTTTHYGRESSGDGAGLVVMSAGVAASSSSSNASVSVVSGTAVPASAPGGHVTVSSGSAGALAGIILIGILASYIVGEEGPKPLPAGTKLLHTCSCYGYQPPVSGETRLADSK